MPDGDTDTPPLMPVASPAMAKLAAIVRTTGFAAA